MSKTPEEVIAQYKIEQAEISKRRTKIALVGIAIIAVLFAIGSVTKDRPVGSTAPTFWDGTTAAESDDSSWIPSGFDGYAKDDNLAWRWGSNAETACTYSSGACWSVILVAKDGCPNSLYGEVNIFDKNDVQISYTNDTLGTVQPMQKVKLTFDTLDDSSDSANISRFSCY